jgi:NADH-quinone oxidoreductase subunit L
MHGMHDDVNMRHYGALRTTMKVTYATFGLGFLAIIGIPPFAGFWSKDEIIHAAFGQSMFIGLATLLGAGVTAFYMTRMMAMTFFGEARWEQDVKPHESPATMTIPMIVLALGSAFGGMAMLFIADIEHWLEPVTGFAYPQNSVSNDVLIPTTLAVILVGAGYAWLRYGRRPIPVVAPTNVSLLTKAARADAYGDAINESLLMRPGQYLTRSLTWFDAKAIDGFVGGIAAAIGGLSARSRRLQNGLVRSYALTMFGGAVLIALVLLLVRL